MQTVRKLFDGVADTDGDSNAKACVSDGVRDFLNHNTVSGRRSAEVQDAVDAVLTAACFSRTSTNVTSRSCLAKAIGRSGRPFSLKYYEDKGAGMQSDGSLYQPETLDFRSDRIRDEAAACVREWCHSEEGTILDTESYRCYLIRNPVSGVTERHPVRVFKDVTLEKRFKSFNESTIYERFETLHQRKIGRRYSVSLFVGVCVIPHLNHVQI